MHQSSQKQEPFFKGYIKNFKALAKMNLTGRESKILFHIFGLISSGNLINLSQRQMGEDLNLDQADISRAITKFKKLNILIQPRPRGHIFINNEIIQFGADINPEATRKNWGKNTKSKAEEMDEEIDEIFS